MNNKIEKLQKDHELKMEIMKLKGKHKKEKNKIQNEIILDLYNAKKDQSGIIDEIRQIKINVNRDKKLIKAGKWLLFWGTIDTIISAMLTISGLWSFFSTSYLKLICFIAVIMLSQFTVFIISKQISTIKEHFIQHYTKANLLRFFLLLISVYGNYIFFIRGRETLILEKIITFILCLCIDIIGIYCISIGNDFKTLNKNISIKNDYIFIKNLFRSVSDFVRDKRRANNKLIKVVENDNLISIDNTKNISDFVRDKDISIVKNTILSNKDGNVCPSIAQLSKLTGFTKNKIVYIKKILESQGFIETDGTTTYLKEVTLN